MCWGLAAECDADGLTDNTNKEKEEGDAKSQADSDPAFELDDQVRTREYFL